jgi:hypothetical protein
MTMTLSFHGNTLAEARNAPRAVRRTAATPMGALSGAETAGEL